MPFLAKLLRRDSGWNPAPLYAGIVARGRLPHWYEAGEVPDSLDGRFDMIAAILSLVLLRLEVLGAPQESARLGEAFVSDMDGQLRQIGIGDVVVGKHIGRMMSALGGRVGAYRAAAAGSRAIEDVLARNLWRGAPPGDAAVAHVAAGLNRFAAALADMPLDALRAGRLPPA